MTFAHNRFFGASGSLRIDFEASQLETPFYLYSEEAVRKACRDFKSAMNRFDHRLYYAVKANTNIALLKIIFSEGYGADVVSRGELEKCLAAGLPSGRIVFSGVGKTKQELQYAITAKIGSIHIESVEEFETIVRIADDGPKLAIRVNPNLEAPTHSKIATGSYDTKFGVDMDQAASILRGPHGHRIKSLTCHLGSQLLDFRIFDQACSALSQLITVAEKEALTLDYIGLGGGIGIDYGEGVVADLNTFAQTLLPWSERWNLPLALEPGRILVGNSGVLVSKVIRCKQTPNKNFVIIDGSMSELIRPALYDAKHQLELIPARPQTLPLKDFHCEVVGPVCESSDTFGDTIFPQKPADDDLVLIHSAGAYGRVMSSEYNSRSLPGEYLVDQSGTISKI